MSNKIKLGFVGGGNDSLIGVLHKVAAVMFDRYEIVGGVFSSNQSINKATASDLGLDLSRVYNNYEEMAKVESEIEQARKQNDDKLIVDKENIDSMPEETSETLNVREENTARWNNSTEKEQWEANVLNKLDEEKKSWILNNWAKNGFKNPKAYLSFLNKFGH